MPGGRPRKPTNLFDLGFPISSRAGLEYLNTHIQKLKEPLQKMQGRAVLYGQAEGDALQAPLLDQWTKVVGPAADAADAWRGQMNVMHQAALGLADMHVLHARQKYGDLGGQTGGFQITRPGVEGTPFYTPVQPVTLAPGVIPSAKPASLPPLPRPGSCITLEQAQALIAAYHGTGYQVYLAGPPDQCQGGFALWYGTIGGTQIPICICPSGVTLPSGVPVGPPAGPTPTQAGECPKCGCALTLDDLSHAPGSSCDKPLYVVLCTPKRKPAVCPPPKEGNNGRAASKRSGARV